MVSTSRARRVRSPLLPLALSATLLTTLAGCGGGGGGGGRAAGLDLTLEDAPLEGLLAFHARVESVVLVRENGSSTEELLPSSTDVEFLGLQDRSLWLGRMPLPSGRFRGVNLLLDEDTVEAVGTDGSPIRLNVTTGLLEARFDEVIKLQDGARLRIDLDVGDSLRGSIDSPPLEFVPTGRCFVDPNPRRAIEAFEAIYEGVAGSAVRLRPVRGRDDVVDDVRRVEVDGDTVLIGSSGPVDDLSGWSSDLEVGLARVEVRADLGPQGRVIARRLAVMTVDGNGGEACVEGLLLNLEDESLRLLVQEVDDERTARLLRRLADDPQRPEIEWDSTTSIFDRSGRLTDANSLELGQRLRVCIATRAEDDGDDDSGDIDRLLARRIEVEALAAINAVIVDSGGLPAEAETELSPDDFWVREDLIDADALVRLDLRDASFGLDGDDDVPVDVSDLGPGSTLIAQGSMRGTRRPEFDARRVLLRAGSFEGCVVDADPGRSRFEARVSRLLSPFRRGQERPELLEVLTGAFTRFGGAAGDSETFDQLWSNLPGDQVLRVKVRGFQRPNGLVVASVVDSELAERARDTSELWPPNHRLVSFDLRCDFDLRDDDGRPLTDVVVTGITQDEPVNGKGDGNTAPDAEGVGSDTIAVRAERAGPQNGRVYVVRFDARDGDGDPTQGALRITVPKSQNGDSAIDDGQEYDSTDDR